MPAGAPGRVKRLGRGKVEFDGEVHYTVPVAARLLKTNVVSVKKLMGTGELEWRNFVVNGPLYISQSSIRRCQQRDIAAMRSEHEAKKERKARARRGE